jgi:hypothetical protein
MTDQMKSAGNHTGLAKRTKIIIAVVVAVAVIACACVAWYISNENQKAAEQAAQEAQAAEQAQWEEGHRTYTVDVTLDVPGFDPDTSTPVPLSIEGTDFEGNYVSKTVYLGTTDAEPLELMRGNYSISVVASPFLDDGTLFDDVDTVCSFTVTDTGTVDQTPTFTFTATAPENVIDDQIDRAAASAAAAGVDEERIAELRDLAVAKRDEALAQIQAQQEADQQAQQETEQQTSTAMQSDQQSHFETDHYSFDLPDYWVGRVDVVIDGNNAEIYVKGTNAEPLVSFEMVDNNQPLSAGDIAHSLAYQEVASNGQRLEVRDTNVTYGAVLINHDREAGESTNISNYAWLTDEVVDVSTGGAYTSIESVGSDEQSDAALATYNYIVENLVPTITIK